MFPNRLARSLLQSVCAAPLLLIGAAQVLAAFPLSIDEVLLNDAPRNEQYPASIVELSIESAGQRMPAHIYLAAGVGPHPTVVLLHGLPGNERNLDLAQALRRFGFNTLYFHYRGAWGAEGEYRFTQLPVDTLAVLEYLRQPEQARRLRINSDALSVLGHSVGGYAALAAGARDPDLQCVISLSPANLGLWQVGLQEVDGPGAADLAAYADQLFMLRGLTGQRLREELLLAPPEILDARRFGAGLSGKSVLMMVGEDDRVTPPVSMFDPVVASYRETGGINLTVEMLPGDHSFSESRVALTRRVLEWSDAHCR